MAEVILLLAIITLICVTVIVYNHNTRRRKNIEEYKQSYNVYYKDDRYKRYENERYYHNHHYQGHKAIENDEWKRKREIEMRSMILNNTMEKNNPHRHSLLGKNSYQDKENHRSDNHYEYKNDKGFHEKKDKTIQNQGNTSKNAYDYNLYKNLNKKWYEDSSEKQHIR